MPIWARNQNLGSKFADLQKSNFALPKRTVGRLIRSSWSERSLSLERTTYIGKLIRSIRSERSTLTLTLTLGLDWHNPSSAIRVRTLVMNRARTIVVATL